MSDSFGVMDTPFVAHSDGVAMLVADIEEALTAPHTTVVCVTGLPGVGKSAAAAAVVRAVAGNFDHTIELGGRDQVIDLVQILDRLFMLVPGGPPASSDRASLVILARSFMSRYRVLIVLDNLDNADDDALDFLSGLPAPSKAFATLRDAAPLRQRAFKHMEFEHKGLTVGELGELLAQLADRVPALKAKYEMATGEEIDQFLQLVQGWPEALILAAAHLTTTLDPIRDISKFFERGDVYERLLGGVIRNLGPATRRALVVSAAFPVSFSVDGLAFVSGRGPQAISHDIRKLLDVHLVEELRPGLRYRPAHPIIKEYVDRQASRSRVAAERAVGAQKFLIDWAARFGGQPSADWSNFKELDREFANVRALMESQFARGDIASLTRVYRKLFSYIVERGYWLFTESWCERVCAKDPRREYRADWLIWWSWIKFYLWKDFATAAAFAEDALASDPPLLRQRFEAHRRALVAYAHVGDEAAVSRHETGASMTCRGGGAGDQRIDLANSIGDARLQRAIRTGSDEDATEACEHFDTAERLASQRTEPNTREVGVARLGRGRALLVMRDVDAAVTAARQVVEHADRIAWLRGIAEGSDLLATAAALAGDEETADGARRRAAQLTTRLETPLTELT